MSSKVRRLNEPIAGQRGPLTPPVEVLPGVPARQSEGQRDGAQQLDDVGNVI